MSLCIVERAIDDCAHHHPALTPMAANFYLMAAKGGIAPPTRGFSGRRGRLQGLINQLLAALASWAARPAANHLSFCDPSAQCPQCVSAMFEGFDVSTISTGECDIFVRAAGSGSPLLLLHGFPETHLMWRDVAPKLAQDFTVVCADLRGYGQSGCPASAPDHAPYSKRVMATDMVGVMRRLGFNRFAVAGHDRGGRVAYRMALDHPYSVTKLSVLDILPTATVWDRVDARLMIGFWPWSLLAQPEPLPERLVCGAPDAVIDNAMAQWGSRADVFPDEVRAAYLASLRDAAHIHAICEEYRAAATIDRAHDAGDRATGRSIACPMQVLWSVQGGLESWYSREGGPLALWRAWAGNVSGGPIPGGHFFPEESPRETAAALKSFLAPEQGRG